MLVLIKGSQEWRLCPDLSEGLVVLFAEEKSENLLPYDGEAVYFGRVMDVQEADVYFERLMRSIEWRHDEAVIFGRHIVTKRMAAWYGDSNYSYSYSNTTKLALPFTPELAELREKLESISGDSFNSVLLNLYQAGEEGMAWHSDDERSLGKNSAIASLSLGSERRFSFRHRKSKETLSLLLEHGSLLVMRGETQANWMHSLPKSKRVTEPRINLTFRQMDDQPDSRKYTT